jgi:hypothetical protein
MTEEAKPHVHDPANCICCRVSDTFRRVFRAFGPSGEAREHFRQSRLEFLKGIRKLIDKRIEKASAAPPQKGSPIVVD